MCHKQIRGRLRPLQGHPEKDNGTVLRSCGVPYRYMANMVGAADRSMGEMRKKLGS